MTACEILAEELRDIGYSLQLMVTKLMDIKKIEDIGYRLPEIANELEIEFENVMNENK